LLNRHEKAVGDSQSNVSEFIDLLLLRGVLCAAPRGSCLLPALLVSS
jgi:hypothetical protein